jgi:hypothetical protein
MLTWCISRSDRSIELRSAVGWALRLDGMTSVFLGSRPPFRRVCAWLGRTRPSGGRSTRRLGG